jgi:hypothetical protein
LQYSISLISRQPRPILLVELSETINPEFPKVEYVELLKDAARLAEPDVSFLDLAGCGFRGVSLDRFKVVLSTGIDVEPTNAIIYVDGFDKALEYGGWPKVVIALRTDQLDATFREVAADTPPTQLAELGHVFGTKLLSADGSMLWLSRLDAEDSRVTTDYEVAYARWIPGDALGALAAVFVLVHPLRGGREAFATTSATRDAAYPQAMQRTADPPYA